MVFCLSKMKENQMYDAKGLLLESTNKDVCDCLEISCPGCHFPCPKCQSEKCGLECRSERCWVYEQIEVEGTLSKISWSASQLGSCVHVEKNDC